MTEPFLGQIMLAGFSFAPRGWALCQGQLMSISQNTALFSLLGVMYGGDGRVTFGLPDLRGRVAVGQGQGPGLSPYSMGEAAGVENVTLIVTQMPQHNHLMATNNQGSNTGRPSGAYLAQQAGNAYAPATDSTTLAPQSISLAGGSQPHENRQPYLGLNYCICLEGIYPARN